LPGVKAADSIGRFGLAEMVPSLAEVPAMPVVLPLDLAMGADAPPAI
jgi:hypothetical protein